MISGAAESNPAMSSMPASLGSAMVKPLDAIPHTMSRASMPVAARYCFRASDGWTLPAQSQSRGGEGRGGEGRGGEGRGGEGRGACA